MRIHRIKKIVFFVVADMTLIAASMYIAFLLRFDGTIPLLYHASIPYLILLSLIFTIPLLFWRRLYSFTWAFVSLHEIVELAGTTLLSALLFTAAYFLLQDKEIFRSFPRSIIIFHHALAFLFLGSMRSAKRVTLLLFSSFWGKKREVKNTLIIGAGESADELIRGLQKHNASREMNGYEIVGILDVHIEKHGTLLRGVKVLGPLSLLPDVAARYDVTTLIIALSQDEGQAIPKVVSLARKAGITDIKIIPSIFEVLDGKLSLEKLRPVRVEDLLGRKPAKIETEDIQKFLEKKDILITGAAGSIGSELCNQIARFSPRTLYALDYEESNLFDLARLLLLEHPSLPIKPLVADIRNRKKMESLIGEIKPHIIFHAAAYKHVPLMEAFPEEAVMTNVFGTLWVARGAIEAGVEKFVLISTDKAVRPVSVMGRTKKIAEMIVTELNGRSATQFISVRFGNVLGSRGSVLPIFEEQIKRRLPIAITHPNMTRFFMTTPEAALLVLEAGTIGSGGEIFVLDMGEPVKIVQFARSLIRLHGLEPDKDIPIVYTKPRPGEKIAEVVLTDEEGVSATRYQKIFRVKSRHETPAKGFFLKLRELKEYTPDREKLKQALIALTQK